MARFGSAMISNTDSIRLIYSTEHIRIKLYTASGTSAANTIIVILKWTRREQGCRRASVDGEPKTVQSNLRHAKIQTTPDLYTQEDSDETRAVQGEFLTAVGMNGIVR